MKNNSKAGLLSILICFMSIMAVAQESEVDVVTKMNGEEMRGKVTKMGDESITFVYHGEDLSYEVNKSEIHKIVFSSGRTQVINDLAAPAASSAQGPPVVSAAERKGKIAVLPFEFTTNDQSLLNENFENRAQMETARSIRENTSNIIVQDPRTTNSLLQQNGIDPQQLSAMPPKDVAVMLGVEFIVYGTLNADNEGARTYGSEVTTYKDKEEKKYESDKTKKTDKGTAISSGSSTTTITYDLRVGLSMYNDQGNNVFSDSREPFGSGLDAFPSSLDYMIKRTPWGSKHK